ncbi:hypothetical protein [Shewanella algae]|uniref:hypothetical protein n=1 Tax=Shewanella algae TaxID=38313 RepID=UPI001AAE7B93|nr:hypothetical protein [Shewanella algae]MBO2590990.1 hypothetical protein [Shewanella algae]MBO2590999.1 hypothetical protein [Shewanella algae]
MPAPAIIGIAALSSFLTALASKLLDFFVQRSISAFFMAAALITAVVTVINIAVNWFSGQFMEILSYVPNWPPELVPLFFPADVAKACLTAVIAGEILLTYSTWSVWLFKLGKKSFKR